MIHTPRASGQHPQWALQSEYLVLQRSNQWWIVLDGNRSGPFASCPIAVAGAIAMAKTQLRLHAPARVSVDEDGCMSVVYATATN